MSLVKFAAMILIIGGIFGLAYSSFSYTKETHEAKLGPIKIAILDTQTINVPVWAGVAAIALGGGLMVIGSRKR